MALDREREVLGVHAAAVVDDADQRPPARFDRDLDALRAGVERVLDELLDRRGRPLDDFAGGDAVDQQRVEATDGHSAHFGALWLRMQGESRAAEFYGEVPRARL